MTKAVRETSGPPAQAGPEPESLDHPFLAGLSPEHLRVLASCGMKTAFARGQLIFRQGEIANRFYLIEEGTVALEERTAAGPSAAVQTIGAGSVLGWSWFFPPYQWHFDARALEDTRAIFFYGSWLRERCEEDPSLGYQLVQRMARVVIERLQAARQQYLQAKSASLHSKRD
jgi:CRP-like cAMP-binding protein